VGPGPASNGGRTVAKTTLTDTGSIQPHVGPRGPSNYAWIVAKTEATMALAQMGFKKEEAGALVEHVAEKLPRDVSLALLIRKALNSSRH
jgi:Holliday junction resolvasome RuvABC DNA-binding subunit